MSDIGWQWHCGIDGLIETTILPSEANLVTGECHRTNVTYHYPRSSGTPNTFQSTILVICVGAESIVYSDAYWSYASLETRLNIPMPHSSSSSSSSSSS
mmetsp:Transcript_30672/g.72387  ORF Transcript_30672/g.72387 Transcript_30672/m.72387 type:complete len:99 (+) Transcript_30672:102-398(+)